MEQDLAIIEALTVDAATLWLEMHSVARDAEFVSAGGTIIYAVDNDVLVEYINPHRRSLGNRRTPSAIEVFRDAPEEEALALSVGLTNFIFYALTGPDVPLLFLPGHASESMRIFNAVSAEAVGVESSAKEEVIRLKNTLAEFEKENRWGETDQENAQEVYEILAGSAPRLLNIVFTSDNPVDQVMRYSQLLVDGRLKAYNRVRAFSSEGPFSSYAAAFPKLSEAGDRLILQKSHEAWLKRLLSSKSRASHMRQTVINADAEALAFLECANSSLQGRFGDEVKMVLITGDLTLLRVCESMFVDAERRSSFKTEYLRTPKAYLSSHYVLQGYKAARNKDTVQLLTDWLVLLLQPVAKNIRQNSNSSLSDSEFAIEVYNFVNSPESGRDRFRQYAAALVSYDRSLISRFRRDWRLHIGELVNAHGAVNEISRNRIAKFLADGVNSFQRPRLVESLDKILKVKSDASWAKFSAAAATLDWFESFREQRRSRSRSVPPLKFDIEKLKSAERLCGEIAESKDFDSLSELSETMDDISGSDPTGYVVTLLMAYLYASAGKWPIAQRMCEKAWELTADGSGVLEGSDTQRSETQDVLSGREALFLRCYIGRVTAQSKEEHDQWLYRFDEVPQILEFEKNQLMDRGGGLALAEDFFRRHYSRFEVEKVAFRLGALYRLIGERTTEFGLAVEPFTTEISVCLKYLGAVFEKYPEHRFRTAINVIGLAVVINGNGVRDRLVAESARFLVDHNIRKARLGRSFLSDLSFLISDILLTGDLEKVSEISISELSMTHSRLQGEFFGQKRWICLTDYDEFRYETMLAWCASRLSTIEA